MAKQTINVGTAPNDGTGDTLKTSFTKCNGNFTELYNVIAAGSSPPQGRLTLDSTAPVMTTNRSNQATIYYAAYVGALVPIYDGTNFVMMGVGNFISCAVSDTTKNPSAIGASKCNDWFVWNDAGTIRLGHGPDWTNDTTRSAGTALVRANGIWLNSVAITNGPAVSRGTYVGTTRSNASSQLDWIYGAIAAGGSPAFFGVWNAYNRVNVSTVVGDTTTSWAYTAAGWRASDNSNNMRVSAVFGLAEEAVDAQFSCASQGTAGATNAAVGVNIDATTSVPGGFWGFSQQAIAQLIGRVSPVPQLGFHFWQAVEYTSGATSTFYGQNTMSQNGLVFSARM